MSILVVQLIVLQCTVMICRLQCKWSSGPFCQIKFDLIEDDNG